MLITKEIFKSRKLNERDFEMVATVREEALPDFFKSYGNVEHIGKYHVDHKCMNMPISNDDIMEMCQDGNKTVLENVKEFGKAARNFNIPTRSFNNIEDVKKYCNDNGINLMI